MSVSSKMTAIADRIRSLLGISGAMGLDAMATNLTDAQNAAEEQSDLIAQISSVLEGKAGGGGITPTGTKTITANGTYDVTSYATAEVQVPSESPSLKAATFTANGTYGIPSGYDGYGTVTVSVPTGTAETWTFTMESGSTVSKVVYVDD